MVSRTNQEFLEYLSGKTSISMAFAQVLVNRGYKDADSIRDFLSPSLKNLHDPFLMPDMAKAVERIKAASVKGETVLVYGDYDADGITSTALMVSALRTLGLKTLYYIPNRLTEGYGLNKNGIQQADSSGASLIITVDCGITSVEEISLAASLGMDTIVTDHHEPPQKLPDALAIINPKRQGSEYPFRHLAGVGVAYKLAEALLERTGAEGLLALVAVGTVADSVDLTGENRVLVSHGLKALNRTEKDSPVRPWIGSLKETTSMEGKDLLSGVLSYTIIPRINAAGRLGEAREVVELFLTQDTARAKGIAALLEDQNRKRQQIEGDVYRSALDMIDADDPDSVIVLSSPDWHPGVIGIVASRLVDMFYRPTFLFSVKDGIAKGSARSIPPFHLYKGISDCADLFLAYGGHSQAAGIKLNADKLPAFRERISSLVEKVLDKDEMIPTIEIDAGIDLFEVNFNLIKELALMEPFGKANQKPVFGAKDINVTDYRIVGKNHLKMKLKQKSVSIDSIGFSMGSLLEKVENSYAIDVAFVPSINEWNGNKHIQLNLKALRPSV
ncbi:single-stranded-DNA-specific exonuclease RecJ [bacterium BMS3Abin10]|nr:single-stranded-DNA-specific exonuclease RecJ [bacterium BMS3Abin10]GBE38634.1 single-stranded-DNA-specific exonuclease RecJ [bacterium BMS3Bbin08]